MKRTISIAFFYLHEELRLVANEERMLEFTDRTDNLGLNLPKSVKVELPHKG